MKGTQIKLNTEECSDSRDFEELRKALWTASLNASSENLDREIENCLTRIGAFFEGDRVILWKVTPERNEARIQYFISKRGADPPRKTLFQEALPYIAGKLSKGVQVVVSGLDDIPAAAAADRSYLQQYGIKSILAEPLMLGGVLQGVLSIARVRTPRAWSEIDLNRFRNLSGVVVMLLDRRDSYQKLEERIRFESFISDISARFVNIRPDQVDGEIERALQEVLEIIQADRCALLGISPGGRSIYVTHAAYAEGIKQFPGDMDLAELFPWSLERLIRQGKYIVISGTADVPPEAETDLQSWKKMDVQSSLTIPLFMEGKLSALIVFNSLNQEFSWTEVYIRRLRLLGEIFVNALERRRNEQLLQGGEARLAAAIDIASLGFYEMDKDYRFSFLDERGRQILGMAPMNEAQGRDYWLAHIHPDDLPRVSAMSRKVLEEGSDHFSGEYRYIHPERGMIWLYHLSRVLERNDAGRAVRVIGVFQDITERKQKDVSLQETMERYRAMIEAYDGLIYICSQDYRVEYMNQRLIERTGHNAVGELCYRVLHDLDAVCPWCVNQQVFRGETVRWEMQSPKDFHWYYIVNTPIQHADGTLSKQAMILDITERKKIEEKLLKRKAELKNSQKDLQRLAGSLIAVKEEELRRLSRELHDDLTQRLAVLAIEAGKLELYLDTMQQNPAEPLRNISRIKEQLINVSEDVHRISRQLHPNILDDLGLVRAIESECAALRQRENIDIVLQQKNIPERMPKDISLCLYRIIQEGLKNSISHSRADKCNVWLRASDERIFLTIKDEGVGFDPAEVRSKPGLGLSSMRERVQLVGGDFSIDSSPGNGTAITVILPLETGDT